MNFHPKQLFPENDNIELLNHQIVTKRDLLNFGNAVPLLSEVAAFMKQRGFQAYDISQLMRRPFDKAPSRAPKKRG